MEPRIDCGEAMRAIWAAAATAAAVFLTAYASPPACRGQVMLTGFGTVTSPASINSIYFARRPPSPYQLNYLQAIKYIDDGMKYIDPLSDFFVSPLGELCFRSLPNSIDNIYNNYYSNWCMYPVMVSKVEVTTNGVQLSCLHAYPQCAHRRDRPSLLDYFLSDKRWIADSITAQTVPYRQERAALQDLIVMMGGNAGDSGEATDLRADRGE
jgi:hypothetical protein